MVERMTKRRQVAALQGGAAERRKLADRLALVVVERGAKRRQVAALQGAATRPKSACHRSTVLRGGTRRRGASSAVTRAAVQRAVSARQAARLVNSGGPLGNRQQGDLGDKPWSEAK